MERLIRAAISVLIVSLPFCARGGDDRFSSGKDDVSLRWQRAALNREWAASLRSERAEEALNEASELRNRKPADADERQRNFIRAGHLESSAARLYGSACANYEKAEANWSVVADLCRKMEDEEREKRARTLATRAGQLAMRACRNAAHAFEKSADAFSKPNANQLDQAAAAGEQAATWWEKLATHK